MAKYLHLLEDEVNDLLESIDEVFDEVKNFSKTTIKIPKDFPVEELRGFTVKKSTDGDHKNDGQMVEYTFKFTSPKKHVTYVNTEMCLMVGWNYCDGELSILL